jgi:hypothetical protein
VATSRNRARTHPDCLKATRPCSSGQDRSWRQYRSSRSLYSSTWLLGLVTFRQEHRPPDEIGTCVLSTESGDVPSWKVDPLGGLLSILCHCDYQHPVYQRVNRHRTTNALEAPTSSSLQHGCHHQRDTGTCVPNCFSGRDSCRKISKQNWFTSLPTFAWTTARQPCLGYIRSRTSHASVSMTYCLDGQNLSRTNDESGGRSPLSSWMRSSVTSWLKHGYRISTRIRGSATTIEGTDSSSSAGA